MAGRGLLLAWILACASGVLAQTPPEAAKLNEQGVQFYDAGNYSLALKRFEAALRLASDSTDIRTNLGKTHVALAMGIMADAAQGAGGAEAYRKALESLEHGFLYWKGDADSHHVAAICHLHLDEADAAARELKTALALEPDSVGCWRLLGVVRERQSKFDEAEAAFQKAAALAPHDPDLALRLRRLRLDRQALREFPVLGSPRFEVHYPPQLGKAEAEHVLSILEKTATELERRWDRPAPKDVVVICYPPGEFSSRTGLQEEIGGAYDGRIRVAAPADLREGGLRLEQVVRHETVHMMLRGVGKVPPRWVDEGLAQLLDGDLRPDWERKFHKLLVANPHVGIEAREQLFRSDQPATWAPLYLHSFLFFRHLDAVHGRFRLDMVVREAGRGVAWLDAFRDVYGKPVAELDREWRRTLLAAAPKEPAEPH